MKYGEAAALRYGKAPNPLRVRKTLWDYAQAIAREEPLETDRVPLARLPANGTYAGNATVRVLPAGVGQEELQRWKSVHLRKGTKWVCAGKVVTLVRILGVTVSFDDGSGVKRMNRVNFLAASRPVQVDSHE